MKTASLLIILLTFASTSFSKEDALTWLTDFEKAKKEAKENNKQILIFFSGSDWCLNCMKLEKKVLSTETFITYAKEKYILVNADFPIKKRNKLSKEQLTINEKLAEEYNPKGTSPVLAIVDHDGNKVGAFNGYKNESTKEVIDYLSKIGEKKK